MNPYQDTSFVSFFSILLQRLTGTIPLSYLPSDELQILTLFSIGASTTLLGIVLSLRKMTMLANSLSHTTLLGIVLSSFSLLASHAPFHLSLGSLMVAGVISALCTSLFSSLLTTFGKVQEDASIGIVFTSLFSVSIILVTTLTKSLHIGTEAILGNVDALHREDLQNSLYILCLNLLFFAISFYPLIVLAFDPLFATTSGVSKFHSYGLLFATSITLISAFRAVGVILVLTQLITPFLAARILSHNLYKIIPLSLLFSFIVSLLGVALSRHALSIYNLPLSTSAIIASLSALLFVLVVLLSFITARKLTKRVPCA